jgi:hypothetical protein
VNDQTCASRENSNRRFLKPYEAHSPISLFQQGISGDRRIAMTIRTTSKTITFNRPFCLKGVDRLLPAGDYRVVTDEELIEGLSFPAYHRISTVIFVPAQSGSAVEMVTIEPSDLQAAQEQDGQ